MTQPVPTFERRATTTRPCGFAEAAMFCQGRPLAVIERQNSRAWWIITLFAEGNVPRSRSSFPKRYRTLEAATGAVIGMALAALDGRAPPRRASPDSDSPQSRRLPACGLVDVAIVPDTIEDTAHGLLRKPRRG